MTFAGNICVHVHVVSSGSSFAHISALHNYTDEIFVTMKIRSVNNTSAVLRIFLNQCLCCYF